MSETPEKKSQVADIDRSLYDFRYEENDEDFYKIRAGLDESIVQKISEEKGDPEWMKEWRLKSLRLYNEIRERGFIDRLRFGEGTVWKPLR